MNLEKLKEEQLRLSKKIIVKDEFEEIKLVAGVDQSFFNDLIISAIVTLSYPELDFVEKKYAVEKLSFPYVPGFLSYRESPVVVKAFNKLSKRPDLLLLDCNGILHQRKIGMASHVGLILDIPTIGVAKALALGEKKDDKIYVDGEVRGVELETREGSKPVYVSPGNRVSLKTSVEIVKKCLERHKLPEPIAEAHKYANKLKKRIDLRPDSNA